jgi:hypothetical protein
MNCRNPKAMLKQQEMGKMKTGTEEKSMGNVNSKKLV